MTTGTGASLAVLLRSWRERAQLTQEQLAERAGVGVRTIRRLESDSLGHPRGDSLRLLADGLELAEAERAQLFASSRPSTTAATMTLSRVAAERGHDFAARQLPADVTTFIGREEQLKEMDAALPSGQPGAACMVAVTGTAGVGKTALAVRWAHRVADNFPDGQLYVNLRGFHPTGGAMDPSEAIRGFIEALSASAHRVPVGLDAQTGLYRSLLDGKRVLIVLDNAGEPEQVRPLLPGTPGCLAVVTSRNQLTGLVAVDGARHVSLDLLTQGEAQELLSGRLGAQRTSTQREAVADIVDLCARLPLALAIAAARAATRPKLALAELATELRLARDRLDALDTGDAIADVRSVFSWSYHRLTPAAARLFRMLGLHPGPDIAVAACASLIGLSLRQTRRALAELVSGNLLTEQNRGRYTLHDLLRIYAIEQAQEHDSADERNAALRRMFDHYLHTAWAADRLVDPNRAGLNLEPPALGCVVEVPEDRASAVEWLKAEQAVLLTAVGHARAAGLDTHTWQLAWTLAVYSDWRGNWAENILALNTAVAAAGRSADPGIQARLQRHLGRAHLRLDRFGDARTHLTHAAELDRQIGNTAGVARSHQALAVLCEYEGSLAEALDHARQALVLFRAAGYQPGEAAALNSVGYLQGLLGNHRGTLSHCRKALALYEQLASNNGQACAYDSLGYAYHHLGKHEQAITCFQRSLDLLDGGTSLFNRAETFKHIGDTYRAVDDGEGARKAWEQALAILIELDHPHAERIEARLAGLSQCT